MKPSASLPRRLPILKLFLKINRGLDINIVCVGGTEGRVGERLVDVFADEEMAVTGFELREARDRVAGNEIELGTDVAVVSRIDAISSAGCGASAAARSARHGIKVVVDVCEPEPVCFQSHTQARVRLQLKDAAHVMNVLQRNK